MDYQGAFIVGTGRCGSTLLSNIIQSKSDVLSLSEFLVSQGGQHALSTISMSGQSFVEWIFTSRDQVLKALLDDRVEMPEVLHDFASRESDSRRLRPMEATVLPHLGLDYESMYLMVLNEFSSRGSAALASHYLHLFNFLCKKLNKAVWVERSGGSFNMVGSLSRCFPCAKFIHIYRDGIDCAISMSKHPYFIYFLSKKIFKNSIKSYSDCRNYSVPVYRYGVLWSSIVVNGYQHIRDMDKNRLLNISYEELLRDPDVTIKKLFSFLGIHKNSASIESAVKLVKPQKRNQYHLEANDYELLEKSCMPGQKRIKALLGR